MGEWCDGDETIASAIECAVDSEEVAAIVLRVDSPGGQLAASERLWNVVERARRKKPVVASFGDIRRFFNTTYA